MKKTLIAALFAGVAGAAVAAPATYNVDPTHTYAQYEVGHMGFSVQSGSFTKITGTVVLDTQTKKGAVDVTLDANSLETFFPARDKHLKSKDFFNVEKFPALTFKSKDLEFKGDKLAAVKGNLTLLGVTKPVTLTVTHFHGGKSPMTGKDTYGANAVATIKRSDFGMMTYLPGISDEVKLNLVIEASKAD